MAELDALTYVEVWSDMLATVKPAQLRHVVDCILLVTVQHHSDFRRRVTGEMEKDPNRLLWMARSLPHVGCERRRSLCMTLLETNNNALHMTAFKIKVTFTKELIVGRATGRCSLNLWTLVNAWSIKLPISAQRIEGLNNEIVGMTKLAPSIGLPLLSSRMSGRQLAFPQAGFYKVMHRYSAIRDQVDNCLRRAIDYMPFVDDILVQDRFETPEPSVRKPVPRVIDPTLVPTQAEMWATSANFRWAQTMRTETGGWWLRGMVGLQPPGEATPEVWACSLSFKHYGELVKCKTETLTDGTITSVSLVRPLTYVNSLKKCGVLQDS